MHFLRLSVRELGRQEKYFRRRLLCNKTSLYRSQSRMRRRCTVKINWCIRRSNTKEMAFRLSTDLAYQSSNQTSKITSRLHKTKNSQLAEMMSMQLHTLVLIQMLTVVQMLALQKMPTQARQKQLLLRQSLSQAQSQVWLLTYLPLQTKHLLEK